MLLHFRQIKNFDKTEKLTLSDSYPVLLKLWLRILAVVIKILYLNMILCFPGPRSNSEVHWHLPNACGGFGFVAIAEFVTALSDEQIL